MRVEKVASVSVTAKQIFLLHFLARHHLHITLCCTNRNWPQCYCTTILIIITVAVMLLALLLFPQIDGSSPSSSCVGIRA